MNSRSALERASSLTDVLSAKLHELPMPATLRNRVAGACFAVALEHQQAVVVLSEHGPPLYSSAFALVRPVYDSCMRGFWIFHCATEEQVESFSKDGKPPDMASLVSAVEKAANFDGKELSAVYSKHWGSFSSFTHTGGLQVQRWNTPTSIESNFEQSEIDEALEFTAALALLSAIGVASLANNDALAKELLEVAKQHTAI